MNRKKHIIMFLYTFNLVFLFLFFININKSNASIYYIVDEYNIWARGSISETKDVASQYIFNTTGNSEIDFGNSYILSSSTENTVAAYTSGTFFASGGDDTTPIKTGNAGYLAAGHGLVVPTITSSGHNKTSEDIGSVWLGSSSYQFVLAEISGNTLTFYSIPYSSSGTWKFRSSTGINNGGFLTHISGATHTENILITSQSIAQKKPIIKNLSKSALINGITPITIGVGASASGTADYIDLVEEYDLVDPSTIITSNNPFDWLDAQTWLHAKIVYRIREGSVIVHTTYNIQRPLLMDYMGFIQDGCMTSTSSTAYEELFFYIPKTKPIGAYDFKTKQQLTSNLSSIAYFNQDYIDDISNPPDRQINLFKKTSETNYDIGFAYGYAPYLDAAPENRECASSSVGCWWVNTTKKGYAVIDGSQVGLIASTENVNYDVYAYRTFLDPKTMGDNKLAYWIKDINNHDLIYIDYHKSVIDDLTTLPANFNGKDLSILDSQGITTSTLPSTIPEAGLTLSTSDGVSYGYIVLELTNSIAPTNIAISKDYVSENTPTSTDIGTFTTDDPDSEDTHTYSFSCDTPGIDDNKFSIVGSELRSVNIFNFEDPTDDDLDNIYKICIRTTDNHGATFDENFDITVNDVDEVPPAITLLGSNPVSIYVGDSYTDSGATASDNVDGDITNNIVATNNVNTSVVGDYTVVYVVSDTASNTSTSTRVVSVLPRPGGGIPLYMLNIMNQQNQNNQVTTNQTTIKDHQIFKYPNDNKVYLLENGLKRWIKDEESFNKLGYKWSDIKVIDDNTITYPNGIDLEVIKPVFVFTKILKLRSVGNDVIQLQTILKKLGYFTYPKITNYYGNYTADAVGRFQKANKLKATGIVDKAMMDVLNRL